MASSLRRAGALTCWGNSYLGGGSSLDDAVAGSVGTDPLHRVVGVPLEGEPVSLAVALGRLRAQGVTALRLVLPEAGDLTGLPGPAALSASALVAGAVIVTIAPLQQGACALLPTLVELPQGAVVRWDVVEANMSFPPYGLPTLSEADRALTEMVAETAATMAALDVARGSGDITSRLASLDRELRALRLPPSLPGRAQRLIASATRLLGVLAIAVESEGGAITANEAERRIQALRPLRAAARYALCAAYSAEAEPEPERHVRHR